MLLFDKDVDVSFMKFLTDHNHEIIVNLNISYD